ncbi:MAG TPA: hemolysin family protein [Dongiaceae bacterium]|jgi:putative hemolysin|nr:hemolysin family protein [Dongiaceae bacterium]
MSEEFSGASFLVEVAIVLLLVLLNGFFAMSELAIVSSRRARLKPLADRGHRGARRALQLAEDPTQFLATVQIGITLVGIVAGAYSGATLSVPVAAMIEQWPLVGDYAYPLAVSLVVAIITYLSLVVGELVPKRIAMSHAEAIAMRVTLPMVLLAKIGTPIVFALRVSTEGLLRLVGVRHRAENKITEEEIKVMIAEGTETGVFMQQERHMIEGVLHLADHSVRTIMTPRPDIEWLDAKDDVVELMPKILAAEHSRQALCEGTIDEVLGFVHVKDLLAQVATGKTMDPRACLRQALTVHESTTVLRLLDLFRQQAANLAIVLDEYGGVQGIVTPRDIFAAIAGEFAEDASDEPGIVNRQDGSWLVDGRVRMADLERTIGARGLSDPEYSTVAGLVLHQMGRLPQVGESMEFAGYRFEVVDMDGRRIDKIIITQLPPEVEE